VGQVVTVTAPDGGARLIGCASRGSGSVLSARCQGLLEALAAECSAGGAASEPAPQLLGRPLVIPEGCALVPTHSAGGRVLCQDGTGFAWVVAETLSDAELTSRRDSTTALMAAASGAVERGKPSPCVVEGTPTQCRVLEERRGKATVRHYVGAANAKGQGVVATCAALAPVKEMPAVCNGVLALP
jgi:hypothetical protein